MPFVAEPLSALAPASPFGLPLERSDILHLAETGLFGLIGVLALLLVLRPMVLRITTMTPPPLPTAIATLPRPLIAAAPAVALQPPNNPAVSLLEDESMVNIAQIEGQMRASSIRHLSELVNRNPDETLAVVRGWMVQESDQRA